MATLPRDLQQLTARQIQALEDGSIIRVPAAIDVQSTPRTPFGNFRVERADEDASDPVRHLLMRFDPNHAVSLLAYATKMLRFWDGEAAVHEHISVRLPDGMFEIPAPPPPNDVVRLIYLRLGDEIMLLGGYVRTDSPAEIKAAIDAATLHRLNYLGR